MLCPIFVILEVIFEVRIPVLMSKIVDVGIPRKDMTYILQTGGLMVAMALISLCCGAMTAKFGAIASMGFGSELRKALFDKVQEMSFANVDKFSTASLVTRLTTDITNTQNAAMMIIRLLIRAPIMLICATFMTFSINPRLAIVFLVAIPFLAIALAIIATTAYPRFRALLTKYDKLNASVQENLIAIRVVKAFVRSIHEKEKFKESNDSLMKASLRAEKVVIFNVPIMQLTMYGCIVSIMWFGGNMIITGTMHTGQLVSFISYVTQILMQLMVISMVFITMVMSKASVTRIIEVLDEKVDITDDESEKDLAVADGSIVFENVCFKYSADSDNNVLDNINLEIKSGETVGIIGGTGSAKTTLVQLIPRLYDVTSGKVLVGGRDVHNYKLEVLRNAVSMVLQKNVLFSGTIKENLKWGNENATDEEVIEACKEAQAHDFVMSFPDKYETDLGQGGVNVSGGQKQRLCIARALLKKPKIIILDDSTSAVDTATDAKIRQAFSENLKDTTTIIIAQRITSICEADKIIVLDDGKIDAVGNHEYLMEHNKIYSEVYTSQQKGVEQ